MSDKTLSIAMITYNHANYIKQAIESILTQNVNFHYEIIIGDDCSTDQTSQILREYRDRYPDIFTLILREENIGATRNLYEVFTKCSGQYIAILEGDDFWTNENKLQMQIDFLKKNKSYIACTHRYGVVDENGGLLQREYIGPGKPQEGEFSINYIENYIYPGHIGTVVFQNIFISQIYDYTIIYKAHRFVGDIAIYIILAALGDIYVMSHNMASYRSVRKKGGTNYVSTIAKTNLLLDRYLYLEKLEEFCTNEMNVTLKHKDRILHYNWWSLLYILRYPSKHNLKVFKEFYNMVNKKRAFFIYILKESSTFPSLIVSWLKNRIRRKYMKIKMRLNG